MAEAGTCLLKITPSITPKKAVRFASIMHKHPNTSPCLLSWSSLIKYLKKNKLLMNIKTIPRTKNMATRVETCIMKRVSLIKLSVSINAITPSMVIPHLSGNTKQHLGEFGSSSTNKCLNL